MSEATIIILAITLFGIILLISGMFLLKSEDNLYTKINNIKELAENANTITELDNIVDQLIEVKKECWHRTHSNAIMIIITIIKTKKEMLCQNK